MGKRGLKPTTKTKKIRVLPIIPETAHLFNDNGEEFVFTHKGQPYWSKKVSRIWDRAASKAGIKINCYNGLRHSWACQRLNLGFDHRLIQTVLGHTNPTMTARYAQYAVGTLSEVIKGKTISKESLLIEYKTDKLLKLKGNIVGGTGIEPATSGL